MAARTAPTARHKQGGFTLIELIVVMAIVALLVSIAAPRYFRSVDRAKENSLRTSLGVMRDRSINSKPTRGAIPSRWTNSSALGTCVRYRPIR